MKTYNYIYGEKKRGKNPYIFIITIKKKCFEDYEVLEKCMKLLLVLFKLAALDVLQNFLFSQGSSWKIR